MKIACLGWGSLIWKQGDLLIENAWHPNGPLLPIEFTRKSKDGRLTLVITEGAKLLPTLWALMTTNDLAIAKESLRVRENSLLNKIGAVTLNENCCEQISLMIQDWAKEKEIDAVIWTNLSPKFDNGNIPSVAELIKYINSVDKNTRKNIEEYVRKAPKQIDTSYRKKLESEFGWFFDDTEYLLSNPAMKAHLEQAVEQEKNGEGTNISLDDICK